MKVRYIILIIIILLLIIIPSWFYIDYYKKEVKYNVDIDIASSKDSYEQNEQVIVRIKITNDLERTFPYDNYQFDLSLISKSDYESGSKKHPITWNDEAAEILESISIPPGETVEKEVPWDMETDQDPGKYYMVFGIWRLEELEKTGGSEFRRERFIKDDKTLIEVVA